MGLEKVGINIGKEIIAWARTGKSLLATKPVKVNIQGLKYAPQLEKDTFQNLKKVEFDKNWQFVKEAYESYHRKPISCGYSVDTSELTEMEKCIASYVGDEGFFEAVNTFCRSNWLPHCGGFSEEMISKYRDALKYALENTPGVKSYNGITYRWQSSGTFERVFGNVKGGDIIKERSFLSTSDNIISCDQYRRDNSGKYLTPELVIINGKNGKKIPEKLAGWNAFEKEVLYNAETSFRYVKTKKVNSADELGLSEHIRQNKHKNNIEFKPCNVVYLEEI